MTNYLETICISTDDLLKFVHILNPNIVETSDNKITIHATAGDVVWFYVDQLNMWAFNTVSACSHLFTGV